MIYKAELLEHETLQIQMDALAAAGWRLISVVVHPLISDTNKPTYMSFWEHDQ